MKRFWIIIPTRNRLDSLTRTLASIPATDPGTGVIVVCDGDRETFNQIWNGLLPGGKNIEPLLLKDHVGAVAARNEAIKFAAQLDPESGILYATDDVIFKPGFVNALNSQFNAAFPDDDGVLGIRQVDSHHPSGVALVGPQFLQRYPDSQLFCPLYWHFAAQEVQWLADAVDKWVYTEEPWVEHFHPAHKKAEIDQTHKDARLRIQEDQELRDSRLCCGQIWGSA
ncbi:glycosyltransferase family 2 protein [bacterium]|nr:glycosyltransferase family 2 protein [bacterium]